MIDEEAEDAAEDEAGQGAEEDPDEAPDENDDQGPGEDDEEDESPAGDRDRLQALQEDIEGVRQRVGEPAEKGESTDQREPADKSDHTLVEEGEVDEDLAVDDTIAPPG